MDTEAEIEMAFGEQSRSPRPDIAPLVFDFPGSVDPLHFNHSACVSNVTARSTWYPTLHHDA